MPTQEQVTEMNLKITQMQRDYEASSREYEFKFRQNCEMVARFDEVLTTKASKVMLMNTESKLSSQQAQDKRDIWQQFDSVEEQRVQGDRKFDKFVEMMNERLLEVVRNCVKKQAKLFIA